MQNNKQKTILVSMLNNVARGNFDSPGGVLDILKERSRKEGIKVILLTVKNFREKLLPFAGENIIIEEGADYLPKSKGIVRKIFHFFYSYLIFTGTTRILATFGAKADRPPAGGNRHLAPLKSAVAGTFGKIGYIKKTAVPALFPKIFNDRPYKNLFDRYDFDLVFVPNIALFPDLEILNEAKRRNIKTVGMACNWDHLNKYFIPLQADELLVQNDPMMKEAIELQAYEKERVHTVGFAQFDAYAEYAINPQPREEFFAEFNIPKGNKLVVFISGAAYSLDEPDFIREILSWIDGGKLGQTTLMIRPYVITRDKEQEEEKFREFAGRPGVVFNSFRRDKNMESRRKYMSMIYHADAVIPIFSTMAIEAAIFDRPIINLGFDGHQKRPFHQSLTRLETMSHFKHVLDTGSLKMARSFPELFDALVGYLADASLDREKRKMLVEKMCNKMDGKASERIVKFIFSKI